MMPWNLQNDISEVLNSIYHKDSWAETSGVWKKQLLHLHNLAVKMEVV